MGKGMSRVVQDILTHAGHYKVESERRTRNRAMLMSGNSEMLRKTITCLNTALGCNDAIDRCFGEGVELLVVPPHEVRLEQVPAVTVVLKFTLV